MLWDTRHYFVADSPSYPSGGCKGSLGAQVHVQGSTSPVRVFPVAFVQVMWTAASRSGGPCVQGGEAACFRMTRTAALSLSEDRKALRTSVVPDPSVNHYVFVVKVRCVRCVYQSLFCRIVQC